jgi:hypothetical protein
MCSVTAFGRRALLMSVPQSNSRFICGYHRRGHIKAAFFIVANHVKSTGADVVATSRELIAG